MINRISSPAARRCDWPGLASGALLAAGLVAIYGRTFSVPFLFGDDLSIEGNSSIRRLWPIWPVLSPPGGAGVGGRPLLNLTYALNYACGGTAVAGYHAVNLLIHVLAAWTLFALVRRTLRRPVLAERFGAAATPLALGVSAIWAWHPVLTESVTYLSQRAESLMGLFYLLTLYCFVRGAECTTAERRRGWFALSVIACLAGIGTKEVIMTAPVTAFLYDRTFISGDFAAAWRRHWRQYLALAAVWLPLGFRSLGLHHQGVGFHEGIAWWTYGWIECRVVVKYLLLALWPRPLIFDYGMQGITRLSEIGPYALVLAALLAITTVALRRAPVAAFAACWFFLILAPTSSVVPIPLQPMAENRLYLPLAGVAAFAVIGAFALGGRRSWLLIALVAGALGLSSFQRNRDYSSVLAIWTDTVAKNPANPRAHNSLGRVFAHTPNRLDDAIAQFEEAVRLNSDDADGHYNLGTSWLKVPGRMKDAAAQLQTAMRLEPDNAAVRNNLGTAWASMPGRMQDAMVQFQEAVRLEPDNAEAHNNLGNAWMTVPGRINEAAAQFEEVVRLRPDSADAHFRLAIALLHLPHRGDEAKTHLETVLRLQPGNERARRILAMIRAPRP